MSDDLSDLVRASAQEDALEAEREYPYSAATVGRFVRDVRRRRAAGVAVLAVAGLVVVGGAALGLGRLSQGAPPAAAPVEDPTPVVISSPSPTPTPTPSPTLEPTPTPTPTPTPESQAPPPKETTPPEEEPPPAPPGAVTILSARPGGGSGEIDVSWELVDGATGYRVYRADALEGPFQPAASIDIATGEVTVEYGATYEYITIFRDVGQPTTARYSEAIWTFGYFQVVAFNAGGEGPASVTVCSEPQAVPNYEGYTC